MRTSSLCIFGLVATASLYCGELPSSTQGKEATGLVNPSSRFLVENGWNFFLNTEFLWWVPKEDDLYYAQNHYTGATTSPLPSSATPFFNGHLCRVHPHFRPGFRVGLGGNMGYDEWDIFTSWTWFKSNARGHKEGLLLTLWSHPDVTGQPEKTQGATAANGKWHLQMNLWDVELGRSFWVGRHLSLRPFIGVRGAWIDQSFRIHYTFTTTPSTESQIRALSDFEGGGARLGADMRFTLLGGWSVYSLASASLLYGFYDCDFHQHWDGQTLAKNQDGFREASSTAQLALGLRWDTYFHKDRYHLGVFAGWEQNIWFGLNKMNHFFGNLDDGYLEQMNGDLSLSGGTGGLRFDF